jgi:hypothetical protein
MVSVQFLVQNRCRKDRGTIKVLWVTEQASPVTLFVSVEVGLRLNLPL